MQNSFTLRLTIHSKISGRFVAFQLDNQIVVVHDAAANMRKATQNSDVVAIALLCIDHPTQLVIQDSISSVPEVEVTVRHFKAHTSKCHKSTLCEERIQKEIDALNEESGFSTINYRKKIASVPTRWNSLCMMLESVISLQKTLGSIHDFPGKDKADLANVIPDEEDLIEEILQTLINFKIKSSRMKRTT